MSPAQTDKPAVHLRFHALVLFGAIVALAMTRALEETIPPLLERPISQFTLTPEAVRLIGFLLTIVRFYVGAAVYFYEKCR